MKHTIDMDDFDGQIFTYTLAESIGKESKKLFIEATISVEFGSYFYFIVESDNKQMERTEFFNEAVEAYNKL